MEDLLWKRLWPCRKIDNGLNEWILGWGFDSKASYMFLTFPGPSYVFALIELHVNNGREIHIIQLIITLFIVSFASSFCWFVFWLGGRDSSVGIATRYGLDGPGIESRWWARFLASVQTSPGAHPASCTMDTASFPWVKRPGRGVDPPLPSSVPRS